MTISRTISVVGCHAEGEVGDVIIGGVLDVPGKTMFDKRQYFLHKKDEIRSLLLNEPRGRAGKHTNLVLPACNPQADIGLLIMENEEYAPMSGSNAMCTVTVLLETGMIPMKEPATDLTLDTAAGLVKVSAECVGGKCKSVAFTNVPSFVFQLDYKVEVPGLGTVSVDIAYGGMMYILTDAISLGLRIEHAYSQELVEIGEKIKKAVGAAYTPSHPENPDIFGYSVLEFTEPVEELPDGSGKTAINTVVGSPGRFDRSPCGTGSSARLAVLHARGQIAVGEKFVHRSILGTEFNTRISGTTKVGDYPAVIPTIQGRAWITGYHTIVLDSEDPFPRGFRVGDQWRDTV